MRWESTSQQPDADRNCLEDDHSGKRVVGVGSSSAPAGQREDAQRGSHHADPDPLASSQLEAEEALGEHRQKDKASGEHRLADRDRGKRERRDVQRKRSRRHHPADAPPLRAKEIDGTAQRVAHVDIGSGNRPLVLEQEAEVRSQRRQQRTEKAHADAQRDAGHRGAAFRGVIVRPCRVAVFQRSRYAVLLGSGPLLLSGREAVAQELGRCCMMLDENAPGHRGIVPSAVGAR